VDITPTGSSSFSSCSLSRALRQPNLSSPAPQNIEVLKQPFAPPFQICTRLELFISRGVHSGGSHIRRTTDVNREVIGQAVHTKKDVVSPEEF
jgi:hypothetical protein